MKKYTVFALTNTAIIAITLGVSAIALFGKNTNVAYRLQDGKNTIEVGPLVRTLDIQNSSGLSSCTLSINSQSSDLTINFDANICDFQAVGSPLVESKGKLVLNFTAESDISITATEDACPIVADEIFIDTKSDLSIYGSNGSFGQNGENGISGINGNTFDGGYRNAGSGANGEDGKDGSAAISCETLHLMSDVDYLFKSGNGGGGGHGGNGGSGPSDSWLFFATVVAANAGSGGNGGNGGNGGGYGGIMNVYDFENKSIEFKEVFYFAGIGGAGGRGGSAGTPGKVTNTSILDGSVVRGKEGKNGTNGADGIDGKDLESNESTKRSDNESYVVT